MPAAQRPPRVRTAALRTVLVGAIAGASLTGCSGGPSRFDVDRAMAHIRVLAGAIGSRPAGSRANEQAREYVTGTLRQYGFNVRVQVADAVWPATGTTARVSNVIATAPGGHPDAVGLVAHYDSRAFSPGAGDDGFGVAVVLEAARVLATRRNAAHGLMVLVTDAEEDGLMGARALVDDEGVRTRLRTYLNFEAIGTRGPVPLFETAAGTGPALRAWAAGPHPRGGSYMLSIYRALPNDTDATVLQSLGIFGLNFAAVGNSHAYHTDRDRADLVSPQALRHAGANAVAIVEALDRVPLDATGEPSVYFSLLDRHAVVLGATANRVLTGTSILAGTGTLLMLLVRQVRAIGAPALIATGLWSAAGMAASSTLLLGTVWLLRVVRPERHPWYAHPERLLILLMLVVVASTWAMGSAAAQVRKRLRPIGASPGVWLATLPVWLAMAAAAATWADAAAYLVTLPLLAAGLFVPLGTVTGRQRLAAALVAGVAWAVLALDAWTLMAFAVATFGRLPIATPTWLLPALVAVFGTILWPPIVAACAEARRWRRWHRVVNGSLAIALVASAVSVFSGPAYTTDRPQRRTALFVDDRVRDLTAWRIAGNEPALDVEGGPTGPWHAVTAADAWRPRGAFAFGANDARPAGDPPAHVTASVDASGPGGDVGITFTIAPHAHDRLSVEFALPEGVVPGSSTLAGVVRDGRWRTRFVNVPREGLSWRVALAAGLDRSVIAEVRLSHPFLPGSIPPARTPPWLDDDRTTWMTEAVTIVGVPVFPS